MATEIDQARIAEIVETFAKAVIEFRLQGVSDLEIGAAVGVLVASLATSKEDINILAGFACRQFDQHPGHGFKH